jgi:hypothetical protein
MRSKFQKRSALKLANRIILHKHGYNTQPIGVEIGSRACPVVYTRDKLISKKIRGERGFVYGFES